MQVAEGPHAVMAEGVGFEPTRNLRSCRFSRPVHSTALPPFRKPHNGFGFD